MVPNNRYTVCLADICTIKAITYELNRTLMVLGMKYSRDGNQQWWQTCGCRSSRNSLLYYTLSSYGRVIISDSSDEMAQHLTSSAAMTSCSDIWRMKFHRQRTYSYPNLNCYLSLLIKLRTFTLVLRGSISQLLWHIPIISVSYFRGNDEWNKGVFEYKRLIL